MKKFFSIILFALLLIPSASVARDRTADDRDAATLRVGYSVTPLWLSRWYGRGLDNVHVGMISPYYDDYFHSLYSAGTWTVDGSYNWKGYGNCGFTLGVTPVCANYRNPVTGQDTYNRYGCAWYFMPEVKLYYYNVPQVRVYGSASVGICALSGFACARKAMLVAQINPIGVECGRNLFGFAELGGGFLFRYFRAGIGYRMEMK